MFCRGVPRISAIILSVLTTQADLHHARAEIPPTGISATVGAQQFATESTPSGRVDFQAVLRSSPLQGFADSETPSRELHFYSFFETDEAGDRSFDLDQTLVRMGVGDEAYLWLGRTLPMAEDTNDPVKTTGAIGASWVQNQSNPLRPRASGWIGPGFHFLSSKTRLFLTAAYSPIFLPSFGPSIAFSETQDATGTRFSRLPPAGIFLNGQRFPLRYRINTGDIADIVLRPQAFVETGIDSGRHKLSILAWSAPSPSAHSSVTGVLKVDAQDVAVLASVVPDFPRETFYGARWMTRRLAINPDFQLIYERNTRKYVASASFSIGDLFEGGYLTTLHRDAPSRESSGSTSTLSPEYASELAWIALQTPLFHGRLVPSLRIERHLRHWPQDQWIHPSLRYTIDSKAELFASASIITGTDASYFGAWRSMDSVSAGVQYQW